MKLPSKPIFYDPQGRRARTTNIVGAIALVIVLVGIAGACVAIVTWPPLPRLTGPPSSQNELQATADYSWSIKAEPKFSSVRDRRLPASAGHVMRLAFFASNDQRSLASLQRNAAYLDGIIPDWLSLISVEGDVTPTNIRSEKEVGTWLRSYAPHVESYPLLTSALPVFETAAVFATATRRDRLVASIAAYLKRHDFRGIGISLPHLPQTSHLQFVNFLGELGRTIRPEGRKVVMVVPSDDGVQRYHELARSADYILINTYDVTYDRAAAGPIASQGWVEGQITARLRDVDPSKLIVSIGSFAYDWDLFRPRRLISVQAAWDILGRTKSSLRFDKQALNPNFAYMDGQGRQHEIWFLDGVTAFNHSRAALAVRPGGLALWRLGLEDPTVWESLGRGRQPDSRSLERLNRPQPASELAISTRADAFAAKTKESPGERSAIFDAGVGLITNETLQRVPSSPQVESWGTDPAKVLALTFDDGPDDRFTPKILDVLHQKSVKATFFVVGRNAIRHPHLVQRIYDEGHDIGNHTFSHPDLRGRPSTEIELELNATQRVLESQLGVRTALFRPAYDSRDYFKEPASARVLETATRLGYVTIPVTIDPNDWAILTEKQIHDRVINQAISGVGRTVLLHDAGGNRSSTISALPKIIDSLRRENFNLVTIHELLNQQRSEVMAAIQTEEFYSVALAHATWAAVLSLSKLEAWLPIIGIGASILGVMRVVLIIIFACMHRRTERKRVVRIWRPLSLTVIVPAYNEEKVICTTIDSLLKSQYPDFNIIVVDDGSPDRTGEVARARYIRTGRVEVYRKENGGKSSALNFGLARAEGDIVVAMDADTVFAGDAIELLVRHFADPAVGAVAGNAVVGNQVTLMARFQGLEYVTSQNLDRRAFERFNAISVVPGAIGAWRKQALLQVGGFSHDTLAEDSDATIAIERRGWKVLYEPGAVAFTEAPETLKAFLRQRFRWMFGTLQVAFKHAGALRSGSPAGVGFISLPNILLFQFAFTLLAPLMDMMLILSLLLGLREWILGSGQGIPEDLKMLASYWLLFQTSDALAAGVGIKLSGRREYWRLLPLVIVQRFCYRQLLYIVAIRTVLTAIRGQLVGWGKLLRTGNVRGGNPLEAAHNSQGLKELWGRDNPK